MQPYLDLLREIRDHGRDKPQRAKLKDGSQPNAWSLFGRQIRFDLRDGFPIVTTKKVPFRLIVGELLWYLSGSTNNNDLKALGVSVWDEWADPNTGELGPIYGKQWRRWQGAEGEVDQIARLVDGIRTVIADPQSSVGRRLILTAWNPADLPIKAPAGCHTLAQFDVFDGELSCHLYQRSADIVLGVPWNIACYALLTHLLAKITGLQAREFIHSFGDVHIYQNHADGVREQLSREPRKLPTLVIDDAVASLDGIQVDQIRLEGYHPHPAIRGMEVAV